MLKNSGITAVTLPLYLLSISCLDLVLTELLHLRTAEPNAGILCHSQDHGLCSMKYT